MIESNTLNQAAANQTATRNREEMIAQIRGALRNAARFIDIYGYGIDPEWADEVERNCHKALIALDSLI